MSHNDDRGHHGGPGHGPGHNPEAALMLLVAGFFVAVLLLRGAHDGVSSAVAEGPWGLLDLALSSLDWILDALLNDLIGLSPSPSAAQSAADIACALALALASWAPSLGAAVT